MAAVPTDTNWCDACTPGAVAPVSLGYDTGGACARSLTPSTTPRAEHVGQVTAQCSTFTAAVSASPESNRIKPRSAT